MNPCQEKSAWHMLVSDYRESYRSLYYNLRTGNQSSAAETTLSQELPTLASNRQCLQVLTEGPL